MKRRITPILTLLLSLFPALYGGDQIDPLEILRSSDRARGIGEAYEVQVKITSSKGGSGEEHAFQVLIKGDDKSLVRFLNPRDKGRQLLMLADDMWIFLPNTRRPVRITPLERLVGNASNGDVARTNYAGDYQPALIRIETVGGSECYLLELLARRKGSTYQKIHYWVGVQDGLPRKADYFLVSGKWYKSASFDAYQSYAGRKVLTRMTPFTIWLGPRDKPSCSTRATQSGTFRTSCSLNHNWGNRGC